MEIQNQPKLTFAGVDIVNINFNTKSPYDQKASIDLKIEPKVFYPEKDNLFFKIIMSVNLKCENYFDLEVVGVGNFKFDIEFKDLDLRKRFVNNNAPAIMFPYIRSFISTLTSNLGNVTGNLNIPTQFFQGDLEEISRDELS
ncbi:MAG: protein-export chaperone SecB [Flavobacteriales bacterium]|nr:protein-export chaperone SecB [Flavobacteriales bacterium]